MRNHDLIAFLKPILNQFSGDNSVEFIDVTGQVAEIQASAYRLEMRLNLPAGIYRGRFETTRNAFDMATAMIEMVRVPDGKRVAVGPWDLDHLRNVMAMPMIRTYVNGKLKGGLWFAMPGPEQIAEGRLAAEFGFEAVNGENELVLELIERDRDRMDFGRLAFLELRRDDRSMRALEPKAVGHPRIFLTADDVEKVRARWQASPEFTALVDQLRTEELAFLTDNSQGTLEVAGLVYALTEDARIGARAKAKIMELAHAPTWSGRPDPLLMGGENDRVIGHRLYHAALGWDYLQPLFTSEERSAILSKVEEYLEKVYDFTLLQRAYMGCPAIDPHSLGSWNGPAIACMAFYDELAVARRALPLFHGLFCESLKLFPASGKAAWATYFPFHLVLYLAAAHVFAGETPEISSSAFLDNLGQALMASFPVPNSQELQRGLRTREHRFLTAFLCRFHPTPGIASIYRAFAEKERKATGGLALGIFDLLYAPEEAGPVAAFPDRPLYAKDVGDLIALSQCKPTIALALSGGPKAGRRANFSLMPHNREFPPSLGALDVTIDGVPVLCSISMGTYGINSALTNAMCFEEGGAITNGQYLNGAISPDSCAIIRRCLIGERFVYTHIVVTHALAPALKVQRADRIVVFDRKTGVIVLSDAFLGERPIRFATHLHCSGSVAELSNREYRLTGGQANLIAGIKGGGKGLDDAEKGEIFALVLDSAPSTRIVVEEPSWVPAYIYGLNYTGKEDIREGRFPRYQRWRLEASEPVTRGRFLVALTPTRGQVQQREGAILLPDGGGLEFGYATLQALDVECDCECLLWDNAAKRITAMGMRRLRWGGGEMVFGGRIDAELDVASGAGTAYAQGAEKMELICGFEVGPWERLKEDDWKTDAQALMRFKKVRAAREGSEEQA